MKTYEKYVEEEEFFFDESTFKKGGLLRQDFELFDEKSYVPGDVIGVKTATIQNENFWNITKNGQIVLKLRGTRFSARERKFLESKDGITFILDGFKQGWNSVSEFKRQLEVKETNDSVQGNKRNKKRK